MQASEELTRHMQSPVHRLVEKEVYVANPRVVAAQEKHPSIEQDIIDGVNVFSMLGAEDMPMSKKHAYSPPPVPLPRSKDLSEYFVCHTRTHISC